MNDNNNFIEVTNLLFLTKAYCGIFTDNRDNLNNRQKVTSTKLNKILQHESLRYNNNY